MGAECDVHVGCREELPGLGANLGVLHVCHLNGLEIGIDSDFFQRFHNGSLSADASLEGHKMDYADSGIVLNGFGHWE